MNIIDHKDAPAALLFYDILSQEAIKQLLSRNDEVRVIAIIAPRNEVCPNQRFDIYTKDHKLVNALIKECNLRLNIINGLNMLFTPGGLNFEFATATVMSCGIFVGNGKR